MEKCGEKTEVYSRVTGYFRPVSNWNKGKKEEKSVYYQTHLWLCPAFPYVKPNAIRFELEPNDEKHRFVFHHGGNEALMDDAPAMGGLMPEGLADRWDFEIEE